MATWEPALIVEFYIRLNEKADSQSNPIQFRQLPQAGDVIAIQPKGWPWGRNEISSPDHTIVALEVESLEKARDDFMTGEIFNAVDNPYPLRRKAHIDQSKLPKAMKDEKSAKVPEIVKSEYDSRKTLGKPMVFDETSDSIFKISRGMTFDIYSIRNVKPFPVK